MSPIICSCANIFVGPGIVSVSYEHLLLYVLGFPAIYKPSHSELRLKQGRGVAPPHHDLVVQSVEFSTISSLLNQAPVSCNPPSLVIWQLTQVQGSCARKKIAQKVMQTTVKIIKSPTCWTYRLSACSSAYRDRTGRSGTICLEEVQTRSGMFQHTNPVQSGLKNNRKEA